MESNATDLSNSLCDGVRHGEKLLRVLIKEQMVIAEMRTAHVSVKIFRLHVQREHISENGIHRYADILNRRMREIGSR